MFLSVSKYIHKNPSKYLLIQIQQKNGGRWCEICLKPTIKTSERRQ